MEPNLTPIARHGKFCFACNPDVPCFNECCRDLNQLLTPYDLLRLKRHLGLPSGDFLAQYTARHTGPESGLPIITLKPANRQDRRCPFVTPKGCRVYENRPSSCRTYPLMRGLSLSRATGMLSEQFMVLQEAHCQGFDNGKIQTVQQWIDEQEIAVYNDINDDLIQIISLKNRRLPGALNNQAGHLFFTALYDLDSFRSQITQKGFLNDLHLDSATVDEAREDDLALLKLGMKWIKNVLF